MFLPDLGTGIFSSLTPYPGVKAGLEKPGFKKKTSPVGFLVFFWFFGFFCLEERVLVFFSVSRILLGASRLKF
jgi:hypothetical protein